MAEMDIISSRFVQTVETHGRASLLFGDIEHVLSVGVLDEIDGLCG